MSYAKAIGVLLAGAAFVGPWLHGLLDLIGLFRSGSPVALLGLLPALLALFLVIALPWVNGVLDVVMAYRFARNGGADKSAILLNWNAFKWGWLHTADEIVEKLPFFKKDLSETFGIRADDGRIT